MLAKLCAYNINGSIVGIQLGQWNNSDLNNNKPFIIAKDGIVPPEYVDITSLENVANYAEDLFIDYQEMQRFMKVLFCEKGWDALNDTEKDICIKFYLDPDKGDGIADTNHVMYLLGKGYNLLDAKMFLVDSWGEHFNKYVNCCKSRLIGVVKVVAAYMRFSDIYILESHIFELKLAYLNSGVLGIGYGDSVPAILNFVNSDNGFESNGMEQLGFPLNFGTFADFRLALENAFMDSYIWNDLKNYI